MAIKMELVFFDKTFIKYKICIVVSVPVFISCIFPNS